MTAFTWRSASATSQGNVRSHNEDAVLELPAVGLWLVADGMGGHVAGDEASRMIVEALCVVPRPQSLSELFDCVEDHLQSVNQQLHGWSLEHGGGTTGSTVAALLAFGAHCLSVWAGDSRVYRLRDGFLTCVTRDHTEAQAEHTASNVITRAVGGSEELYLDVELRELRHGDRYLLCSDGLYRELSETDLVRHLACNGVAGACRALMSQALAGACRDNVSVVVVEFSERSATDSALQSLLQSEARETPSPNGSIADQLRSLANEYSQGYLSFHDYRRLRTPVLDSLEGRAQARLPPSSMRTADDDAGLTHLPDDTKPRAHLPDGTETRAHLPDDRKPRSGSWLRSVVWIGAIAAALLIAVTVIGLLLRHSDGYRVLM